MKFLVAAAALTLALFASSARADPSPRQLELADSYMKVTRMEQTILATMKPLTDALLSRMPSTFSKEEQKQFRQAFDEESALMVQDLVIQMKPLVADVYTEQELTDVVAFMSTPSGQAMLQKAPILTARMAPLMPEMQRRFGAKILERFCHKVDCGAEVRALTHEPS